MSWRDKVSVQFLVNLKSGFADRVGIKRISISVTNLKPILVRYLGWGILYAAKPFGKVNAYLHRLHKKVLDWNDK
jgi:hypothetical protein